MEELFKVIMEDVIPQRISDYICNDSEIRAINFEIANRTKNTTTEENELIDLIFSYGNRQMMLAYELGYKDAISMILKNS